MARDSVVARPTVRERILREMFEADMRAGIYPGALTFDEWLDDDTAEVCSVCAREPEECRCRRDERPA